MPSTPPPRPFFLSSVHHAAHDVVVGIYFWFPWRVCVFVWRPDWPASREDHRVALQALLVEAALWAVLHYSPNSCFPPGGGFQTNGKRYGGAGFTGRLAPPGCLNTLQGAAVVPDERTTMCVTLHQLRQLPGDWQSHLRHSDTVNGLSTCLLGEGSRCQPTGSCGQGWG